MSVRAKLRKWQRDPNAFFRDARFPVVGPILKPGTEQRGDFEAVMRRWGIDPEVWLPPADQPRKGPSVAGQPTLTVKELANSLAAKLTSVAALREASAVLAQHRMILFRDKFTPEYLRSLGLKPATVIDVGVNYGTPDLYSAFPKAKFVLVEPLQVDLSKCMKDFPDLDYDYHKCAAGSQAGSVTFSRARVSGHSSLMSRVQTGQPPVGNDPIDFEVEVVRLDELLRRGGYRGPFGIKVDTEGFELETLRGAADILKDVQFIIAELSIKRIFVNGYRFSEVIAYLGSHGFELADVLNARGSMPNHFDCLFLKHDDSRLAFRG